MEPISTAYTQPIVGGRSWVLEAFGGGAWLRCWPDGLNWALIQSLSPVYRFLGLCQITQPGHPSQNPIPKTTPLHPSTIFRATTPVL